MEGLNLSAYPSWIQAAIGIGFMAAAFFAALNGRYAAKHHNGDASVHVVGGALADRASMMLLADAMTETALAVRGHTRALNEHAESVERLIRSMLEKDHNP